MAAIDIFSLTTGPYVPDSHAGFGLLPRCHQDGGEVFSYPAELDAIDELVSLHEDGEDSDDRKARLIPYGMKSYAEYFELLVDYANKYKDADPELFELITWLIGAVKRMNVKEDWSIARYVGSQYDDDPLADYVGLTKGRCYYWPCSRENPVYEGVIDNEEFTSYLYPCDPDSWEIVADPTGMAARALSGNADTVSSWHVELAEDPGSIEAWAQDAGTYAKHVSKTTAFDEELDEGWSDSEADPVDIPCPGCGKEFRHHAPTLVNARKDPELRDKLIEGTLFEFTCPRCGYTASLVNPCLYLDPAHHASIYLVISDDMAEGVSGMFDDLGLEDTPVGRSLKRIVFDRHDLRGRAITLDEGLDDRAIEILKIAVSGSAKMQGGVPADDECIVNLTGVKDGDLVFHVESGDTSFSAVMPRGGYELYRDAIRRSSVANEQPYFVGKTWAHHAIDALGTEGIM